MPGAGAGAPSASRAGGGASLREALNEATCRLHEAGIASARVDAELLAAHLLKLSLGQLRAAAIRGAQAPAGLGELVAERARRIPLQHLTGTAPFAGLELAVGPGVFVPRPETEVVALAARDAALERARARGARIDDLVVADLCTGSGAIAAALASWLAGAQIHAVEIDPLAHAWAQRNLAGTGVHLVLADAATALPGLEGQVDVVVSNPPYVPAQMEPVDPEVARHDPRAALYGGGEDGLALPRLILARAAALLAPGGWLVMEHGERQGAAMRRAALSWHLTGVSTGTDLAGRDRMLLAQRAQ